jgi:hypothetical protein
MVVDKRRKTRDILGEHRKAFVAKLRLWVR